MKPVRILVIKCGAGESVTPSLKAMLESPTGGDCAITPIDLLSLGSAETVERVSGAIRLLRPHMLLLCLRSGRLVADTEAFFGLARQHKWAMPVVIVAEGAKTEALVKVLRLGASEFLTLPLREDEVVPRLWSLHPFAGEEDSTVAALRAKHGLEQIVGETPSFVALVRQIPLIAKCDAAVMLTGETGSGKEVFSRAIHYLSPRSAKPFVPVNCGAIPVELTENEFFGHDAGAYTSANASRRGVIAEAHGGTLFLDEIDCLPPLAQVKILRFLQDGQFRPLGSERVCRADVRVIAASNADLTEALESGRFRRDLYYRLNVLTLRLPPLRERPDDIPLLAHHFLVRAALKLGMPARTFSPAAVAKLISHDWPGNARELQNVVEGAVALSEHACIQPEYIRTRDGASPSAEVGFQDLKARAIQQFERSYIRQLLLAHGGNITKAAQSARKDRRAFWELMRKHHISAQPPCPPAR
jgi:two-component system response regulator GlrR